MKKEEEEIKVKIIYNICQTYKMVEGDYSV